MLKLLGTDVAGGFHVLTVRDSGLDLALLFGNDIHAAPPVP